MPLYFLITFSDQEDFLGSPETFFFFPTDIEQPILIIIVDDSIVESSELFNVVLNSTDPSVNFFAESTEVLIIDDNVNDGKFACSLFDPTPSRYFTD